MVKWNGNWGTAEGNGEKQLCRMVQCGFLCTLLFFSSVIVCLHARYGTRRSSGVGGDFLCPGTHHTTLTLTAERKNVGGGKGGGDKDG